jgi:anti-sigma B factor antagonist
MSRQPASGRADDADALTVSVSLRPGCAVVSVSGALDVTTEGEFRERLTSVLAHGVPRLLVDLSGVTFMASAGLGVLTGLHHAMASEGGKLVLASPPEVVTRVLSLTGADRVIPVVASVAEVLTTWTDAEESCRSQRSD